MQDMLDQINAEMAQERGIDPATVPSLQEAAQAEGAMQAPKGGADDNIIQQGLRWLRQSDQAVGEMLPDWLNNSMEAMGAGATRAALETKDFVVGEGEPGPFRQKLEGQLDTIEGRGAAYGVISDISQFSVGIIGAGKLMAPISGLNKIKSAGTAGRAAWEIGRGALAGGVVLDPYEERLSNLIEKYPALQNPVTGYLAADPDDSAAEGRLKNALEGAGIDLAMTGAFALVLKGMRYMRSGNIKEAQKVLDKAADALPEQAPTMPKAAQLEVADVPSPPMPKASQLEVTGATPAAALPERVGPRRPVVDLETFDPDAVIAAARADSEAIKKYGSRELAAAAGHKFAGENLPWQKLGSTDELANLKARTQEALRAQYDKAKGGAVLADKRVAELVNDSAAMWGEDPAAVFGYLRKAGDNAKHLVADMEASYMLARKMFEDTWSLAEKIRMGNLDDWGGDSVLASKELKRRFQASADMMATGHSIRSNVGRTMRRMRSDFSITPEDIAKFESIPDSKLAEVLASTRGDLKKLRRAMTRSFWEKLSDEGSFLLANNLLWKWPTHVVNTTTNMYMLMARPMEKALGSFFVPGGKSIRRQAWKEMSYTFTALGDGWNAMVAAFDQADSIMAPHMTEHFQVGNFAGNQSLSMKFKPVNNIWDVIQNGWTAISYRNVVGLPTRALGASDEFFKTLRYRGVVQAKAAMEGTEAGLKGRQLHRFIEQRMEDAFAVDGRALDDAALQESMISTFQQELIPGTLGAGIRNLRSNWHPLRFILPYVKTPVNVLRYAHKMTPGLNLVQHEYRQMLKGAMGPEAQAQAVGQMTIGGVFASLATGLALEGKITGGGPADPKLKSELMSTGWRPYSFIWEHEDGTRTHIPFNRFDPIGLPFGMAADIVDMQVLHPDTREAEKGVQALGIALAKNFSERTFLLNMNQFLRALTDPDRNAAKWAGSMLGNMVPMSSAISGYGNSDPLMRDARGIIDNSIRNLPYFSEGLNPRRTAFGDTVWRQRGLTMNQEVDLVEEEHNRIIEETGFGLTPPSPKRNGIDLRDHTLESGENAYDQLQRYAANLGNGRTLKSAIERLVVSDNYQLLVDGDPTIPGTKLGAISDIVSKFREAAWKKLIREDATLRRMTQQKQIDIKSKVTANRKEAQGGPASREQVDELLKSLGYN